MLFKNLVVYRLPAGWQADPDDFERKLGHQPLQPCGGLQMESRGWSCPHEDGIFLYQQNRQWLLALGSEQKLLPSTIVRQEAEDRAEDLARRQGHPVGRKQMRDLKEQVLTELMPRALSRRRLTVSTSGVVPMIDRLAQDCPVALAVSLHAPNDELRNELVPINR